MVSFSFKTERCMVILKDYLLFICLTNWKSDLFKKKMKIYNSIIFPLVYENIKPILLCAQYNRIYGSTEHMGKFQFRG